MNKYMPLLVLSSMLSLLIQSGCAHAPTQTLGQVLSQAAVMATGPCAQGIITTMQECKTQYPNLPW